MKDLSVVVQAGSQPDWPTAIVPEVIQTFPAPLQHTHVYSVFPRPSDTSLTTFYLFS